MQQQNLAPMQQAVNLQIPVQGQPQQQYMPQLKQQQAPFQQQPLQQQPIARKQPVVQQRPLPNPVQKQAVQQPVAASLGSKLQQQLGKKDSKEPPLQKPKLDGGAGRDLKEVRSRREVPIGGEEVLLKKASSGEEEALHESAPGDGKENLIPDTACFNDPQCAEKFSRNPVSDSLDDRDFAKILNIGSRSLLSDSEASEANLTKKVRSL